MSSRGTPLTGNAEASEKTSSQQPASKRKTAVSVVSAVGGSSSARASTKKQAVQTTLPSSSQETSTNPSVEHKGCLTLSSSPLIETSPTETSSDASHTVQTEVQNDTEVTKQESSESACEENEEIVGVFSLATLGTVTCAAPPLNSAGVTGPAPIEQHATASFNPENSTIAAEKESPLTSSTVLSPPSVTPHFTPPPPPSSMQGALPLTAPTQDVSTMALPGSGQRDPTSQQLLMLAEFSDGYSLRNLIEYLKASNTTTGRLIFSRDRITFVRSNYQATVLNEVVFRTYDLPRYIYNTDQPLIVFGANMNNIRPITRSIGKKDSARLFMQKGDTRLYIQIISQNAKALSRENVNVIVSQNVEPEGYDLEDYVRSVDRPNCSVPCHDFTKMCGAMNSLKCSYVTAKGFENGMTFIGMIEGNIFGRVDRFGECGSALTDLPLQNIGITHGNSSSANAAQQQQPVIRISISIVKALSKINNLTSNGNIRMYFEHDRPLKLVCNVGTYGQLNIYLKEEDNVGAGSAN